MKHPTLTQSNPDYVPSNSLPKLHRHIQLSTATITLNDGDSNTMDVEELISTQSTTTDITQNSSSSIHQNSPSVDIQMQHSLVFIFFHTQILV